MRGGVDNMADIAEIGFAYNPAGLKRAKADLDAIMPSAKKVEAAKLAVAKADLEAARASLAAAKATGSATKEQIAASTAAVRKATATLAAAKADHAAAGAASAVGAASAAAAGGLDKAGKAAQAAAGGIAAAGNASQGAVTKISRLGSAANDNLNAVQATPANIAAQFQDIGVTAAAGMNPLLVGLQQGTQLSVAFSNGLKELGPALKQVFSATALLTIGTVTLAVALLQMVDWISVGKTVLNGLADALEYAAPYAAALAGSLALLYSPAIIGGIVTLTKGVWALAAGLLAAASIPVLIAAGLVAIVAAANYFRDDLTKILGFDIVAAAKTGVNFVVGMFVGGYNGIVKSWGMIAPAIDDILAQAVQFTRNRIEQMINSTADGINGLLAGLPDWMKVGSGKIAHVKFEQVGNPNAGAAAKVGGIMGGEMKAAQGVDYVGKAVDGANSLAKWAGGKLRGFADGLGKDGKKKGGADKASTGKTDAEKEADRYKELVSDLEIYNDTLIRNAGAIGLVGAAEIQYNKETEIYARAKEQNIDLTKGERQAVIDLAIAKAAAQEQSNITLKAHYAEKNAMLENISALEVERDSIGLSEKAAAMLAYEKKLLNDETFRGIIYTDQQKQDLIELKDREADLTEEIKKRREATEQARKALEFDRAVTRGFFTDLMQGARDGQGAWEAFKNAFNNVMDKIIDKLLNEVLDAIFQVNNAAAGGGGGGGGGLLGLITSLAGIVGGGGMGGVSSIMSSTNASLGAGTAGMVGAFAKGDAFASTATGFAYGRGGANMGIMGEAGPEAVMPLQRGPDGSLGVQMYGNDNSVSAPPQQGPVTFDMRGAVVTQDLLNQMNGIAAERADVAVQRNNAQNTRLAQRKFGK